MRARILCHSLDITIPKLYENVLVIVEAYNKQIQETVLCYNCYSFITHNVSESALAPLSGIHNKQIRWLYTQIVNLL